MENIIGLRYGMKKAHRTNEAWFKCIGIKKSIPFNFFSKSWVTTKLKSLNQLFGFINSLFIPPSRVYVLTSTGCVPAVILKKKLFKIKIIAINSDTFFFDLSKAEGFKKKYMLWLLKHVDGIISTSNLMKKLAEKYSKVPHEIVNPFCKDRLNKFSKIKPDYKSNNLCSISTARYSKGADILKKVFLDYKKEFPNSKLFVLGKGDASPLLRKEKDIINPDFADPADYFKKSGVYVNLSRIEPFGVNIIEAMAAGLPTLITKTCGASEIVKKTDPWLLCSLNLKEILKKIIVLQKNINKKRSLGKKCRKIALEFKKQNNVNEFKEKFNKILKKIK